MIQKKNYKNFLSKLLFHKYYNKFSFFGYIYKAFIYYMGFLNYVFLKRTYIHNNDCTDAVNFS